MWVRQESHVEEHVYINRYAVFEPERLDGEVEVETEITEGGFQAMSQVVDAEVRGVDDDIGTAPQSLKDPPFADDSVDETASGLQRMGAADVVEPAHERFVGRLEEQDAGSG